jgi:hypothetical protein
MPFSLKKCLLYVLFMPCMAFAQDPVTFNGLVRNTDGDALIGANVIISGTTYGTITDESGNFSLEIDAAFLEFPLRIRISYVGYFATDQDFTDRSNIPSFIRVVLRPDQEFIPRIDVSGREERTTISTINLDPEVMEFSPTVGGSVESIIQTFANVRAPSELSDQYSVRGGNYDENLVYVNDFEIYRPFLMRSGQQEGLSFINPDLVRDISFSSGGFEAKYGDKMSSVLDIKYKRPTEFKGSFTGSLRGVSAHVEGSSKSRRFRYLTGVRYKNTASILKSLDTKGQYNPNAFDVQTDFLVTLTDNLELEALFNHSSSFFNLVPSEQQTTTGAVNQAIRFSVFFDGNEKDFFRNTMGGLSLNYTTDQLNLKFMGSTFRMKESENFNIIGQYRLDEVETDFSSDDFGDVKATLGVGTFHDWGRNDLDATVFNIGHKGRLAWRDHLFLWGTNFQHEWIDDKLSEWERLDSAGYSLPYTGEVVSVFHLLKTEASLSNWRTHGYLQNIWNFEQADRADITFNAGVRYHYWSYNKQFIVSPRALLSVAPQLEKPNNHLVFKIAAGMYEQPPFYREIRDREGRLNDDVKAQRSVHVVFGTDYHFRTWNDRNFKFSSELYYKHLSNVNPYELDDIRIRYYGDNLATGYAYGLDVRLFGELVKGTDSWMSFSIMNIKEDLANDMIIQYLNSDGEVINPFIENQVIVDTAVVYPGHIAKPTEQVFNFGLYFSDYMTKNKNFKMHLALQFGTGLPYGPPDGNRYTDVLRAPGYKRVDIGFSALLLDGKKEKETRRSGKAGQHFDKIWLSAEIFNLLGNRNTVSYRWIKDTQNLLWPLPNFLTSRRFNIKMHIKFS